MNLLEKYLAALKPLLPRKMQTDILQEISDEIESQMEERAETLGRPLTEEEEAQIIRKHGHPVVVAARYGQARYLIGPELFPFYWRTLRVSVIVAATIWCVVIAVGLMSSADPLHEWAPVMMRIPGVLITIFGVVTGLFAAAELSRSFVRVKVRPQWDPRTLPQPERHSARRTQSVVEALLGVVGLVWWKLVPSMPFLALGPGSQFLKLGPAWETLHWLVLILIAAHICKSLTQIVWPERRTFHTRLALLLHGAELVVLLFALNAGDWVTVNPTFEFPRQVEAVAGAFNRLAAVACFIGLLVRAVQFAFRCVGLWRRSGAKSGWRAASAL